MSDEFNIETRLEWLSKMKVDEDVGLRMKRKTSVVCTIGKNNDVESLLGLLDAGMNIARLNFSHGDHEFHRQTVENIRKIQIMRPMMPIAIALDTKGPELRTGMVMNDGSIEITKKSSVILTSNVEYKLNCTRKCIYIDYPSLVKSLKVGQIVYIEDGNLTLLVDLIIDDKNISCIAQNTHTLTSRKNVNLPGISIDLPSLSDKDLLDLKFAADNHLDIIFASFTRDSGDVLEMRKVLESFKAKDIKIISKIENQQGIKNFDDILSATDGVMVARGDLGMEIPLEKVFVAQKMMISKCNIVGKPVICATQMLESMTNSPRPTRAECSDVANAVLDGADCVMLSGETAKGKFPIESVKMMHQICIEAERSIAYVPHFRALQSLAVHPMQIDTTETIASSAVNASMEKYNLKAIIVITKTGNSARLISKYRPRIPIITVTGNPVVARQCHLYRGCHTVIYEGPSMQTDDLIAWQSRLEERIQFGIEQGIKRDLLKQGDDVLLIHGWAGGSGKTNTIRVVTIN